MIFTVASFHHSIYIYNFLMMIVAAIRTSFSRRKSMFNRSGEGYAALVLQNLITHQTALSLRFHDDEKNLKFRLAKLNVMAEDIGERHILLEAMQLDIRGEKSSFAYHFLLRYGTGCETMELVNDTFNPPSSTVRDEGFACIGVSTEMSPQYTATPPFSMPSYHLLSLISKSNDIKKNIFVWQRLESMPTFPRTRDRTRYRSWRERN
jgi:hypothetical protein